LHAAVEERWHRLFPKSAPPPQFTLVKVGGALRPGAPVSFLVFLEGTQVPSFHLKVSRDDISANNIEQEYSLYSALYRRAANSAHSLSEPMSCEQVGPYTIYAQRAVGGRQFDLLNLVSHDRVAMNRYWDQALDWLLAFQRDTLGAPFLLDSTWFEIDLDRTIAKARALHAMETDFLQPGLAWLRDQLRTHFGATVPGVGVHGDFNHYNLLFQGDAMYVIDWEHCQARGLPIDDVVFLYLQAAIACEPEAPFPMLQSMLGHRADASWAHDAFTRALNRVAAMHGFGADLARLLVPYYLAQMLTRDYRGGEFPLRSVNALSAALKFAGYQ
jgi:thiamine kinase-like enzyme